MFELLRMLGKHPDEMQEYSIGNVGEYLALNELSCGKFIVSYIVWCGYSMRILDFYDPPYERRKRFLEV